MKDINLELCLTRLERELSINDTQHTCSDLSLIWQKSMYFERLAETSRDCKSCPYSTHMEKDYYCTNQYVIKQR